jgi:hypothetical protein
MVVLKTLFSITPDYSSRVVLKAFFSITSGPGVIERTAFEITLDE